MKLKNENLEPEATDDFYYDLFIGGYIKPEKFLDEESAQKVREAIKVISEYEQLLIDNNLLEEM